MARSSVGDAVSAGRDIYDLQESRNLQEGGIIFIPVGLIIAIVVVLLRFCLRYEPNTPARAAPREVIRAVITVMTPWVTAKLLIVVRVMLADGHIEDSEILTIRNMFDVDQRHVMTVAAHAATCGSIQEDLEPFLKVLTDERKDTLLTAMIEVANADGEVHETEQKMIDEAAEILGTSKDHLQEVTQKFTFRIEAVREAENEAGKRVPPDGATVRLFGLIATPEHNGRTGVVTSFVPESRRCNVQLLGKYGNEVLGEIRAVKLSNLEEVSPSVARST